MDSQSNLKPFSSENQPKHRGSRKGVPNRATIIKKWAKVLTTIADPSKDEDAEKLKVTLLDAAAIGQLLSAAGGNTNAWREIQDSIHGKLTDKSEVEHGGSIQQKIIVEVVNGSKSIDNTNQD